jgi:hypothetical protein
MHAMWSVCGAEIYRKEAPMMGVEEAASARSFSLSSSFLSAENEASCIVPTETSYRQPTPWRSAPAFARPTGAMFLATNAGTNIRVPSFSSSSIQKVIYSWQSSPNSLLSLALTPLPASPFSPYLLSPPFFFPPLII